MGGVQSSTRLDERAGASRQEGAESKARRRARRSRGTTEAAWQRTVGQVER